MSTVKTTLGVILATTLVMSIVYTAVIVTPSQSAIAATFKIGLKAEGMVPIFREG